MSSTLHLWKHITREKVKEHPNWLFAFGDNMQRRGYGGQAKEMRGEPNTVGIPTKWAPTRTKQAYFRDKDAEQILPLIGAAFDKLSAHLILGNDVVYPVAGVGSGLSELAEHAPKIWSYVWNRQETLEGVAGVVMRDRVHMYDLDHMEE